MAEVMLPPDTVSEPGVSPLKRNFIWYSFQMGLRLTLTAWLRYRARGVERIPRAGGGLLLSNHQSFLDPILIGLPLRRPVSFLARDTLFKVPILGWILKRTYVMPLNRDGGSTAGIKQTLKRMEQGFLVGVFPEGTRSADGTVGVLKPGFAALVRRTKVPVYPIGIAGADRALGRGKCFLRPARVCVVFGQPFTTEEIEELSQRGREAELIAAVRERIVACQDEATAWLCRRRGRAATQASNESGQNLDLNR
jgi:1-acyl-sn-glycerol-3-phosphate acyltransferase